MQGGRVMARRVVFSPSSHSLSPLPASVASNSPDAIAAPFMPKRQKKPPLIIKDPTRKTRARCAEMAGAATAECTAVVCCCPCAVIDIIVLTTVRLPAGLCKKAMRKKRAKKVAKKKVKIALKKKKNYGLLPDDDDEATEKDTTEVKDHGYVWPSSNSPTAEEKKMEEEMWDKFYGAGFWRSPSQKE